jgi:acyl-CoA oxidase
MAPDCPAAILFGGRRREDGTDRRVETQAPLETQALGTKLNSPTMGRLLGAALAGSVGVAASVVAASASASEDGTAFIGDVRPLAALAALVVLLLLYSLRACTRADDGTMDAATLTLLEGERTPWRPSSEPENKIAPECEALIGALNGAAATDDEAECAQQMRDILASKETLSFRSLVDEPQQLLQCSEHMCNSAPGALWTRFTVSYNLYAGSVVALGSDEQRAELFALQSELGCFAFTEKGAGVLSGAGVETTATYDTKTDNFIIHSPTPSASKVWISQGLQAERAVILAELIIDGEKKGPHLFWARIAERGGGPSRTVPGVTCTTLPPKMALRGLDNAYITFDSFAVPRSSLLSRFCEVERGGAYTLKLPDGVGRMLDLLISRLLTGRICLSEGTIAYALSLVRRSWSHCVERELWRGRKPSGPKMASMPLISGGFRDYSRSLAIVAAFIRHTRARVAEAIRTDVFSPDLIEATCMCKFIGTGFGVDAISACRKLLGSRAIQADAWLGEGSFVANATCAAEGDNTVMELKVRAAALLARASAVVCAVRQCCVSSSVCRTHKILQLNSSCCMG